MFKRAANHPLSAQKEHACEGDGEGVKRGECVGQSVDEDFAGMTYECPTGEACGCGGEYKDPNANGASGHEVVC
jgi:hypothetical protein